MLFISEKSRVFCMVYNCITFFVYIRSTSVKHGITNSTRVAASGSFDVIIRRRCHVTIERLACLFCF